MRSGIILFCCLMTSAVYAQKNRGIQFLNAKNWQDVLTKAKADKKNIFIDAYATWCGPCKKMDAEVYTDPHVGAIVNENFISVKIQFDKTVNDSENVKSWYVDAKFLMGKYHITAFPSYLFFSYEGELIDKGMGYQPIQDFIALVKRANDPHQNYTALVHLFRLGKLDNKGLLDLALKAKKYQDDSLGMQVAKSFKVRAIDNLEPSKIVNPDLWKFFGLYYELFSTKDSVIQYLYRHQAEADRAMTNKGYSRTMTDYQIRREFVDPVVNPNGKYSDKEPAWANIEKQITEHYDVNTSNRLLLTARLAWYKAKKDWPNVVKYTFAKTDTLGVATDEFVRAGINNMAFGIIFKHSDDPVYINKGITLMEMVLRYEPSNDVQIDTYANLLYKSGRKNEGMIYEKKALKIATDKNDESKISEYENNLKKMLNNEPTWSIND